MECPRWRLIEPHYINVACLADGTKVEWEHKETARETGRTKRILYPVPALLDPKDPADQNYPQSGEIIVSRDVEGATHHRGDIIILGDPTPGMEPLNEEAQAITDALRHKWDHPIDSMPANGGMNEAEKAFMERMIQAFTGAAQAQNQTVPKEQYDALLERVAKLEAAAKSEPAVARRA